MKKIVTDYLPLRHHFSTSSLQKSSIAGFFIFITAQDHIPVTESTKIIWRCLKKRMNFYLFIYFFQKICIFLSRYEFCHKKTNIQALATSVNPDKPMLTDSMIQICTGHLTVIEALKKLQIKCRQWNHTAWICRHSAFVMCTCKYTMAGNHIAAE